MNKKCREVYVSRTIEDKKKINYSKERRKDYKIVLINLPCTSLKNSPRWKLLSLNLARKKTHLRCCKDIFYAAKYKSSNNYSKTEIILKRLVSNIAHCVYIKYCKLQKVCQHLRIHLLRNGDVQTFCYLGNTITFV